MGHPAVDALSAGLARTGWVSEIWCHGSLATGDHRPGISDIDLVALTTRSLTADDLRALVALHREIDGTAGRGAALGCTYVDAARLADPITPHPTWTHGGLHRRRLSAMVRAELLTHGYAVVGREPGELLSPMSVDEIRAAARGELVGYWSWAARRPWLFLRPSLADLALVSMARARHTLDTGELVSKSRAIDEVRAPRAIVDGGRGRRTSPRRASPLLPRLAVHAWLDTRRTIAEHRD